MDDVQQEVTDIFIRTKALLQGHFILRSGLHSGHFFQCAQVCQDMPAVERLGTLLKLKLGGLAYDTVLAPAMGGLVIGQEVARQSGSRFIFAEKENNILVLRRGFTFRPDEKLPSWWRMSSLGVAACRSASTSCRSMAARRWGWPCSWIAVPGRQSSLCPAFRCWK